MDKDRESRITQAAIRHHDARERYESVHNEPRSDSALDRKEQDVRRALGAAEVMDCKKELDRECGVPATTPGSVYISAPPKPSFWVEWRQLILALGVVGMLILLAYYTGR